MTDLRAMSNDELAAKLEHIPVASGYAFDVTVNVCRRLREDGARITELENELKYGPPQIAEQTRVLRDIERAIRSCK